MVIQPRIYILTDVAGIKFTARFMKVPEVKKMEMPTSFRFTDEPDDVSENVTDDVVQTAETVEDSDAEEAEEEEEEEGEEYEEVEEEEE